MREETLQLVLRRITKNADKTKIAAFINRVKPLSKTNAKKLLIGLPRIVCEVSSRSEGELLQDGLDVIGAITDIETVVADANGRYRLSGTHHQLVKKELSKALRSKTSLAIVCVQLGSHDTGTILPSMLGDFQDRFAAYFRESDTVFGIDEDQLLLLCFATDKKGALRVRARIKQAVQEILPEATHVKIGFSLFPDEGRSISDLFQQARPKAEAKEEGKQLEVRTVLRGGGMPSERSRDQQRVGTIQLYFTLARGRLFQRLLSLDAKALWHGLSKLTKKEQQGFVNRLPFDYKLAPTLDKIIASNPPVTSDKELEKHLEEVIYAMTSEEGLEERKQYASLIATRLNNVDALPVLPGVASKLFNILADPDAMIDALAKVIETDPSLTLKMLKIVNSAFYGVYRKIDTVKEAVVILGTDEIQNLAFGLSAAKTFQNIQFDGLSGPNALWHHSIGTAIIAEYLCAKSPEMKGASGFTAGLIHDAGKIFLMAHFPDLFNEVCRAAVKHKTPVYEMEEEKYGLNHAMIGKVVAIRWNLPEKLSHTIAYHHHHQPDASHGISLLAAIIALADHLYHQAIGEEKTGREKFISSGLTFGQFKALRHVFKGLNNEVIESMAQEVARVLEDNQSLFSVS